MKKYFRKLSGGGLKSSVSFSTRRCKEGGISLALIVAAVLVVAAVNLLVSALPSSVTLLDTTTTGLYSLSQETKNFLEALDTEVEVYWICADGSEDIKTETILGRYADRNSNIKITQIDPAYNPNFVRLNSGEDSLVYNSLIIKAGGQTQVVRYSDYNKATSFELEDYLNSALQYVINDTHPAIYCLTGHGEDILSESAVEYMNLDGHEVKTYSLLAEEAMPEDMSALLVLNPDTDLAEGEAERLIEYLESGGRLLLVTGFLPEETPNLARVMAAYGLQSVEGYICEGDGSAYYLSPTYIIPQIKEITALKPVTEGVSHVLLAISHGISSIELYRSSLKIMPFLVTSDTAYSKVNISSMDTSYEVGDIQGPFSVGTAVTESCGDGETRVVWLSSSALLESSLDETVSGGNSTIFLNICNWLAGGETSSLHAKSTVSQGLTIMSYTLATWSVIMLGVIPFGILAAGTVICFIRRRR